MYKVASFGEVLWDKFPEYKTPGGSPANVAYHLHLLGNESYLISKVGEDKDGEQLLNFLSKKELPVKFVTVDPNYPTGLVTVTIDHNNEPSYTIHQPSAWDYIQSTPDLIDLSKSLDAICFASLSQRNIDSSDCLNTLLDSVPEDCLKVFDLNLRPPFINKEVILTKIYRSDVIKMNEDEFQTVGKWLNSSDTADVILSQHPEKMILLTLGERGSALFTKNGHFQHKAYPITGDGDFVGVGDAFLAAFTYLILNNKNPADILETCNRYAALVASQKGGMPNIPETQLKSIIG